MCYLKAGKVHHIKGKDQCKPPVKCNISLTPPISNKCITKERHYLLYLLFQLLWVVCMQPGSAALPGISSDDCPQLQGLWCGQHWADPVILVLLLVWFPQGCTLDIHRVNRKGWSMNCWWEDDCVWVGMSLQSLCCLLFCQPSSFFLPLSFCLLFCEEFVVISEG